MASTVSLNRGDGWANGYRYAVSPTIQGQTPFVQLPITESEPMGVQDFAVSYAGVTNSFGNPYVANQVPCVPISSSQVLQNKTDGSHQDYYPAYTEVQSTYGYNNLDHYGTTNVGKAVAMSLASMENCNAMGQVQDSRVAEGLCQSILPSNANMVNSNGEFLFNEFLGGENDLLEVCKQNDGSANYYKMQSINARDVEDNRTDSLMGAEFPMSSDNIYINIDTPRKEETCETYANTGQTITSVQKKYKFYGKGRPYDIEGKTETTREQYDATYLPESHYQRGAVGETSQQYPYPNELHLLSTVNRTIAYGIPEIATTTRDIPTTNFQFPSGSGYYPTVFHEDTSNDRSEDTDSRTGSCKSDDRVSKDEKRAKELKIPLTTHEIISLPIDEFNEKLSKFELTDPQLSLIRDIRRRGKNKVAAQNCRKRKLDQIYTLQNEVQNLHLEKARLETQQEALFKRRMLLNEKYVYVFQLINNFDSKTEPIVTDQPIQQYHM